jgi:hypothetical protein
MMAPVPQFAGAYLKMSQGEPPQMGSWNEGSGLTFIGEPTLAVDGGDGLASVKLDKQQQAALKAMLQRLLSDPSPTLRLARKPVYRGARRRGTKRLGQNRVARRAGSLVLFAAHRQPGNRRAAGLPAVRSHGRRRRQAVRRSAVRPTRNGAMEFDYKD